MSINGYLVMRNKPFYFEIRIYKLKSEEKFSIGVTRKNPCGKKSRGGNLNGPKNNCIQS